MEEAIVYAKKYLEDLLSFFGLNTDVYATSEDDVIELEVPSTHLNGFLIGQKGENMRSMQFLVSNALKNQGYHFEHNYGHGEQHLSVVFAMLMMLAFLVDQAQQLCCALFRAVWLKLGSKRLLWERMRALFYTYALTSMRQLFEALLYGFKRSSLLMLMDSS